MIYHINWDRMVSMNSTNMPLPLNNSDKTTAKLKSSDQFFGWDPYSWNRIMDLLPWRINPIHPRKLPAGASKKLVFYVDVSSFPKSEDIFRLQPLHLQKTNMAMENTSWNGGSSIIMLVFGWVFFGGVRETSRFCEATKTGRFRSAFRIRAPWLPVGFLHTLDKRN